MNSYIYNRHYPKPDFGSTMGGSPFHLPQFDKTPDQLKRYTKPDLIIMLVRLYAYYGWLADECHDVIDMKDVAESRAVDLAEELEELKLQLGS